MVSRFQVWLEWDSDDQVWITYVPSLNLLSTFGETREEALTNTREAIVGYLEALEKEGLPAPQSSVETEIVEVAVP